MLSVGIRGGLRGGESIVCALFAYVLNLKGMGRCVHVEREVGYD